MRTRDFFVALSLAILLVFEMLTFRRWELKRRALQLPKLAGLSTGAAERAGSMYEFDPEFGRFLEAVESAVPSRSSIAVSLPQTTRLYLYTAHYALAPRRVLEAREGVSADFLAVYDPLAPQAASGAWRVPGGTLSRQR
ncbi:MAG: hypothetical protein ACRD16_05545 [Thermoanaerobaculia bacterium]